MSFEQGLTKNIYIPILGISYGELMILYGDIYYGLAIRLITLLAIIIKIISKPSIRLETKNVLQSFTLLILLQVINLSMPRLFNTNLQNYLLLYGIMFIPIYSVIRNQQISSKELGIDFRRFHIYIPIALIIGTIIATFEYKILNPAPLINEIRFLDIVFISIVMLLFIGLVEELIFRSVVQTRIEKVLGSSSGILLSGIIFGIMHSSYGIIGEILFASIIGIILGYIFYKTRSLPFTVSIHGSANIILYGILPRLVK